MQTTDTALFLELAENVAGVGSWWIDLIKDTAYWSKQVYLIHGVTPEEHKPDLESGINFYHPDDRDLVQRYVTDAIEKKQSFDFELRILRPDNSVRWVHSKGGCRTNNKGVAIGIYGIFQDITERRKTEEQLRESEERFELAVKGSSVGLWDWNVNTNALYWSPRYKEIASITDDAFVPDLSEFENRLHRNDHDYVMKCLQNHLESGEPYDLEYRFLQESGEYIWIHARGQAIWDNEGNPLRMAGSVNDIHAKKQTERRFELAVKAANSGIWDWLDVEADVQWWSPRFYHLLGYEDGELEANLANFKALLHPDDLGRTFALVKEHFEGNAAFDLEYRLKTKSGTYRWFQGYGEVQLDEDGAPMRMVGSITDIQSRKKAEDTIAWQVKALDNAINGIAVLDHNGCFTYMNQANAKIYGYDAPEDLYGQPWQTLYNKASIEIMETQYMPLLAENGYWHGDTLGKKKDGTSIYTDLGLTALDDGGLICVCQDATDRVRMSNSLKLHVASIERSNKELDDFAYVASHDLKAPLRAIDNLATWIIEDANEVLPEESKTHLGQLRQRVNRMEELLHDLLEYSRAGRVKSHVEEIDTSKMTHEVIELLSPTESFVFDVMPGMPSIISERSPIQQVFLNLIGNAIKHHDRSDGLISISCTDLGALIEFSVSDDGPGIPKEFHERIFLLFQTLKPRDEVEGSGMGLSIIKKLIHHHQGSIRVVSEEERGTTFFFTWPKIEQETEELIAL